MQKEHLYNTLASIAEIMVKHGLRDAVLCPGSRSAPMALSILRNKNIHSYIIPDERSAAYTALGIAQSTGKPVAILSTSGTAALNFAPAVAEAYWGHIPLIVITADRPPEWIGQADNQSIYQNEIYGKHVRASYSLSVDLDDSDTEWMAFRVFNEALSLAKQGEGGPVHVNIPFREPFYFYEKYEANTHFNQYIETIAAPPVLPSNIENDLLKYSRILVVAGTMRPDPLLMRAFNELLTKGVLFFPDITSNLTNVEGALHFSHEIYRNSQVTEEQDLAPELLITIGGPIVSKHVKNNLLGFAKHHWHVGLEYTAADTYTKLERVIVARPVDFIDMLSRTILLTDTEWVERWKEKESVASIELDMQRHSETFTEFSVVMQIIDHLPKGAVLHLGNSMPVRHATKISKTPPEVEIFSNRGTSGIDGCVSTAAGHSIVNKKENYLIVGDLSFQYDNNGLWNNYKGGNLKIIVLNNHGGGIFRTLKGPASQPELEEYFVVKQTNTFGRLAEHHGCKYLYANSWESFMESFNRLQDISNNPVVLECEFQVQHKF